MVALACSDAELQNEMKCKEEEEKGQEMRNLATSFLKYYFEAPILDLTGSSVRKIPNAKAPLRLTRQQRPNQE
jgi:hypothetical protein